MKLPIAFRKFGKRCLALVAIFSFVSLPMRAQVPVATPIPAQPLPVNVEIGHAVANPRPDLQVTYTVMATAPLASKAVNQKIRLIVNENGMRDVATGDGQTTRRQGTSTRSVSINTGKSKTLAQINGIVTESFRRFLGATAPNQELGKVGDVRYGGELRFVAETPDSLRFDYLPEGNPASAIRFTRADVQGFLTILGK